jgi:hypothetical protein
MARGIKTGGRKKGTSNKLTGTVKEMITQFVTEELQNLPDLLKNLEPKEKAEYILKLLPYIAPKIGLADAPKEQSPQERRSLMFSMFKTQTSQNTPSGQV